MATAIRKNFDSPDKVQPIPSGNVEIVNLGQLAVVRSTFNPGWRWSESVKPIAHTDSCQVHHVGYQVAGRLRVKIDGGSEVEYGPGDVYDIPPGHDAWVLGSEPVVMVDFRI
jgi:quercetin dioxygenase-like cupin family protein